MKPSTIHKTYISFAVECPCPQEINQARELRGGGSNWAKWAKIRRKFKSYVGILEKNSNIFENLKASLKNSTTA